MQSGTQSDHVNLRAFKRVLAACGIKMKSARDQERAKAIFHKLDADNNGTIDFNEFVQGLYGVDRTVSERILIIGFSFLIKNDNFHLVNAYLVAGYIPGYRYFAAYGLSVHVYRHLY